MPVEKTKILIRGGGPGGLYTALELESLGDAISPHNRTIARLEEAAA